MLNSYHEELEFDFDERGWDLLDVWRGEMSLRKLWVRIKHLPRTAAFCRAVAPELTRWGSVEHVIADFIDEFRMANFKPWEPFPRPGVAQKKADFRAERQAKFQERQQRVAQQRGGR